VENNKFEIPGDIRALIDYDFLKMLQNELYMIFNLSLEDYEYDNSALDGGTSGWGVAFGLTCIKSNKKQIYDYYRTLSWDESDIFDGLVVGMMSENRLVLPKSKTDYLCEALCLPQDEIGECWVCGKCFLKGQLIRHVDSETDTWFDYRCNSCDIKSNHPEQSNNANEYYRNGISIVRKELGVE
jgi:hypothetical protein